MRRLHLPTSHLDLTILSDESLGDVDRICTVLRKSDGDVDLVDSGSLADTFHLGAVDAKRVLDIANTQVKIHGSCPKEHEVR